MLHTVFDVRIYVVYHLQHKKNKFYSKLQLFRSIIRRVCCDASSTSKDSSYTFVLQAKISKKLFKTISLHVFLTVSEKKKFLYLKKKPFKLLNLLTKYFIQVKCRSIFFKSFNMDEISMDSTTVIIICAVRTAILALIFSNIH